MNTTRLEQVKGVGTLIALTYLLTLEDPHRFRKSRDVGCYVGLQPVHSPFAVHSPLAPTRHQSGPPATPALPRSKPMVSLCS
jgi:hypothetical protein